MSISAVMLRRDAFIASGQVRHVVDAALTNDRWSVSRLILVVNMLLPVEIADIALSFAKERALSLLVLVWLLLLNILVSARPWLIVVGVLRRILVASRALESRIILSRLRGLANSACGW